jgi:hypothetical protein
MGNTFTVEYWRKIPGTESYNYTQYWQGKSLLKALWHFFQAKKKTGSKQVVLFWR